MWPSIVYQPTELAKSLVGAKIWLRAIPLRPEERADYAAAAARLNRTPDNQTA